MQDLKKEYKRLVNSKEFKHKGFLSGAFIMSDIKSLDKSKWQIDFYNKKENKITTYLMDEKIEVTDNSEVFKEENAEIKELDIEEIKENLEEALKLGKEFLEKEKETPIKVVIILQKEDSAVWNLSYITEKFNLINIKIDAVDGKLLKETTAPLLSFKKDN